MRKRRTDDEWMQVIQECKSSGYSDTEWCRQNNIPVSTFYLKLNALRMKATINEPVKPVLYEKQEVVCINLQEENVSLRAKEVVTNEVALRLAINGITIEVLNNASKTTIENTLTSLRSLC